MKICIIKLFCAIMLITVCLCSMDVCAAIVAKGTCGDNLTWILDDAGLLTISGTGDMYDYYGDYQPEDIPWYPVRSKVFSVVLENGVTSIGNDAFYECTNLSDITISDSFKSIGYTPYEKCNNINKIYINNIEAWCNIDFSGSSSNPLYFGADLYVDGVLADDIVIP
ncbi:MAG: leucine-rich repeat protein, partial [Clostridia bacterium]|nr:leucine-rich repeat protein [Clostridia bacterium]